ncbi:MAG: glycosyltransferase [Alphaproteobacteria bacterium]|nr:glycosyltransferase [Alphaproteobacteria bacterium]
MMTVLTWLLRALLALIILGWLATFFRVRARRLNPRWGLTPEDPPAASDVRVSVVIPARDEEDNLGACLDSVLAQDHPNLQIVVQDDGSTDRTGAILAEYAARDDRVHALTGGDALPEGWFGKPWALERAQRAADGDWLVFIDADVRLHPAAVSRAVGYGEREGLGMVTGFGTLVNGSFWEKVLQPAVAGMILMGNDLDEVNDPDKPDRNMASGQFIAVRRDAYEQLGRHEAVKADILDDVGLARAAVAAGVRYHCLFLRQLYRVRMYTSLREIWDGWSKNLFAGMHYSWGVVVGVELFLFVYIVLGPLLAVLGGLGLVGPEWLVWGLVQLLVMQAVRAYMDRIWGNPLVYGLTHAPANLMLMALIVNSGLRSRGAGVRWRGRTYVLDSPPERR